MAEPSTRVDISVLVLAYNHQEFVAQCLDGILAQDFPGTLEVLVGEDCSTDGTRGVVQRYVERFSDVVRLVTSAQNVGMHANFRRLLAASTGEYVAICEGDDYWHAPDKLTAQVAVLQQDPSLAGVHADVDHLVLGRRGWLRARAHWARMVPDRGPRTRYGDLLVRNLVQTCSVVVRGDVARAYPESDLAHGCYVVEDWPFFLHATRHGPLAVLPRSLATYRSVPGSVTNRGAEANERRVADQFRLIDDAAGGRPELAGQRLRGLRATRDALLLNAIDAGDREMLSRALAAGREAGVPDDRVSRAVTILLQLPGAVAVGHRAIALLRAARTRLRYSPAGRS